MALAQSSVDFFRKQLFGWAGAHPRPMPWKGEKDPYRIWLSEIILQQTRVDQGWAYYLRFTENYPTVFALAEAPVDEVLKHWEGLGYYSRARNLHATARHVAGELNGVFPGTFEGLLSLKGIGEYTAAAVASFAYDLPHAVLDGNVYRILARYFGIDMPSDLPAAKKYFSQLAQELLDPARPGAFNQAMMDFGAMCCTPLQPKCSECPLQSQCIARQQDQVSQYPKRQKKAPRQNRWFLYLVIESEGQTLIRRRGEADIWQGLYEFPMLEVAGSNALNRAVAQSHFLPGIPEKEIVWEGEIIELKQVLTHRQVTAAFLRLHLSGPILEELLTREPLSGCQKVSVSDLKKKFALPGVIVRFLKKFV